MIIFLICICQKTRYYIILPKLYPQKKIKQKATENNKYLTIGELAEVSGTRLTTLKYYTEIGILPFSQDGIRLTRKYKEKGALKRLEKIKELKKKRLTIKEIINYFKKF